jgi:hypothetical protein
LKIRVALPNRGRSVWTFRNGKLMPQQANTRLDCQLPVRNTKWLQNAKLRKAILSAFYNISQRNFGILLILWCSFKMWWNFCLDQNLVYNANGPFRTAVKTLHSGHLYVGVWGRGRPTLDVMNFVHRLCSESYEEGYFCWLHHQFTILRSKNRVWRNIYIYITYSQNFLKNKTYWIWNRCM